MDMKVSCTLLSQKIAPAGCSRRELSLWVRKYSIFPGVEPFLLYIMRWLFYPPIVLHRRINSPLLQTKTGIVCNAQVTHSISSARCSLYFSPSFSLLLIYFSHSFSLLLILPSLLMLYNILIYIFTVLILFLALGAILSVFLYSGETTTVYRGQPIRAPTNLN